MLKLVCINDLHREVEICQFDLSDIWKLETKHPRVKSNACLNSRVGVAKLDSRGPAHRMSENDETCHLELSIQPKFVHDCGKFINELADFLDPDLLLPIHIFLAYKWSQSIEDYWIAMRVFSVHVAAIVVIKCKNNKPLRSKISAKSRKETP